MSLPTLLNTIFRFLHSPILIIITSTAFGKLKLSSLNDYLVKYLAVNSYNLLQIFVFPCSKVLNSLLLVSFVIIYVQLQTLNHASSCPRNNFFCFYFSNTNVSAIHVSSRQREEGEKKKKNVSLQLSPAVCVHACCRPQKQIPLACFLCKTLQNSVKSHLSLKVCNTFYHFAYNSFYALFFFMLLLSFSYCCCRCCCTFSDTIIHCIYLFFFHFVFVIFFSIFSYTILVY